MSFDTPRLFIPKHLRASPARTNETGIESIEPVRYPGLTARCKLTIIGK